MGDDARAGGEALRFGEGWSSLSLSFSLSVVPLLLPHEEREQTQWRIMEGSTMPRLLCLRRKSFPRSPLP